MPSFLPNSRESRVRAQARHVTNVGRIRSRRNIKRTLNSRVIVTGITLPAALYIGNQINQRFDYDISVVFESSFLCML